MRRIRFCAYQYADQPLDELLRRWKRAEELGFDVLWNCDAINDPDFPRVPFFEATSILTAMAMHTSTIRVGTLMNSRIFRNPAVVAKAAMTIDHISGGRLEFGFGGRGPGGGSPQLRRGLVERGGAGGPLSRGDPYRRPHVPQRGDDVVG